MIPEHRPIVLARKPGPLRPLAIDACRIGYTSEADSADVAAKVSKNPTGHTGLYGVPGVATFNAQGRWPSNVLLEDAELFDEPNPYVVGSGAVVATGDVNPHVNRNYSSNIYGSGKGFLQDGQIKTGTHRGDTGGYSRFFRIPGDDLIGHLTKLVTPPDGVVLDPFKENGVIHQGDAIEVMAKSPSESVDAVVTDPPYNLAFMGRSWDAHPSPQKFQAWCTEWGREALRVTKPGGYLLAFGGTRTHHRLVCGLEDAGWIIRDELTWVYASGFPKGKANLKPAHEPIVLARKPGPLRPLAIDACRIDYVSEADRPTQEEWNRAGSSGAPGANGYAGQFSKGMKDAYAEGKIPVPPGRWPSNLLLSDPDLFDVANPYVVGSGAVTSSGELKPYSENHQNASSYRLDREKTYESEANTGGYSRFFIIPKADRADREPVLRGQLDAKQLPFNGQSDHSAGLAPGSVEAKMTTSARENSHPTVKPVDLMRHLVRLVTPSSVPCLVCRACGGTVERTHTGPCEVCGSSGFALSERRGVVLDCFLGSGSTAIACEMEGFPWIGVEKEPEYVAIAEARLNGVQRGLGLDVPAPTRKQPKLSDVPQGRPFASSIYGNPMGPPRQVQATITEIEPNPIVIDDDPEAA